MKRSDLQEILDGGGIVSFAEARKAAAAALAMLPVVEVAEACPLHADTDCRCTWCSLCRAVRTYRNSPHRIEGET